MPASQKKKNFLVLQQVMLLVFMIAGYVNIRHTMVSEEGIESSSRELSSLKIHNTSVMATTEAPTASLTQPTTTSMNATSTPQDNLDSSDKVLKAAFHQQESLEQTLGFINGEQREFRVMLKTTKDTSEEETQHVLGAVLHQQETLRRRLDSLRIQQKQQRTALETLCGATNEPNSTTSSSLSALAELTSAASDKQAQLDTVVEGLTVQKGQITSYLADNDDSLEGTGIKGILDAIYEHQTQLTEKLKDLATYQKDLNTVLKSFPSINPQQDNRGRTTSTRAGHLHKNRLVIRGNSNQKEVATNPPPSQQQPAEPSKHVLGSNSNIEQDDNRVSLSPKPVDAGLQEFLANAANAHKQTLHDNQNKELTQRTVWSTSEILELLEQPQCKEAVQRARERHPRKIAICPLCSGGHIPGDNKPIEYLKFPKAGSTSMVNLLTHRRGAQTRNPEAQMLCEGREANSMRIAMVREPTDRLRSAFGETHGTGPAGKTWKLSNHQDLAHKQIDRLVDPIHHVDAFLDDYFRGRLENWDGGMPHHMVSSALHLHDAVVVHQKNVTVLGRMEHQNELMDAVSVLMQAKFAIRKDNVSQKRAAPQQRDKTDKTEMEVHMSHLAAVLFEEDFVCFGYPLPTDIPEDVKKLDQVYREYQSEAMKNANPPACSSHYTLPKKAA